MNKITNLLIGISIILIAVLFNIQFEEIETLNKTIDSLKIKIKNKQDKIFTSNFKESFFLSEQRYKLLNYQMKMLELDNRDLQEAVSKLYYMKFYKGYPKWSEHLTPDKQEELMSDTSLITNHSLFN